MALDIISNHANVRGETELSQGQSDKIDHVTDQF